MNRYPRLPEIPMDAYDRRGGIFMPVVMALVPTYDVMKYIFTDVQLPATESPRVKNSAQRWRNKLVAAVQRSKRFPTRSKRWWAHRRDAAVARRRIKALGHNIYAHPGFPMQEIRFV